ncbi:MAG: TspO/MBR family protein, partial [Pseudomonadales bacterium]
MKIRIITWLLFYACTLVAAAGAFWFVGDFGPVWTILYLMIATSGYRIFHAKYSAIKGIALGLWALQMCLNTLWTPVFFGAFDLQGALIVIFALWLTIGAFCGVG